MVFKLVRTDTVEPCKIQLPIGKHLIGRGKLLDCEDKRVSRNHGEVEVGEDKVVIKALHHNPCFIIRKGSADTQILKQNCSSDITNGDKFGLLPDSYWYELLHCVNIDSEVTAPQHAVEAEQGNETNGDSRSEDTEPIEAGANGQDDPDVPNLNTNTTIMDNIPDSPSLLDGENGQATEEYSAEQNPVNNTSEPNNETTDNNPEEGNQDNVREETKSPSPKRCHSPDDSGDATPKKIKTEPVVKQDPDQPDNAQAGPSNDQADSNDSKDQKLPPPAPVLRERCMYGANCYRRNPQHKAQFSHPSDSDWGAGAQAPCPYGGACRKRDARHWRDHAHPPGARPPDLPPLNQPGNKRRKPKPKRRNSSEDDDDDTPTTDLIVQGKRTRKTVVRKDDWSGSESENEDPYATDESDEWQPSGDMTDSQLYSQDV